MKFVAFHSFLPATTSSDLARNLPVFFSIPCPWHSFSFISLFGPEILCHMSEDTRTHGGKDKLLSVWVRGQTPPWQSPVLIFSHVIVWQAKCDSSLVHRCGSDAQAQTAMTCDLSPARSKQDMGFYTHTQRWEISMYSYTHDSWPQADRWSRKRVFNSVFRRQMLSVWITCYLSKLTRCNK